MVVQTVSHIVPDSTTRAFKSEGLTASPQALIPEVPSVSFPIWKHENKKMSELKKLKSIDEVKVEKICVIEGIKFEPPKLFLEYLEIGFYGICLLITLPLWIWFYLAGKIIKLIAQEKEVKLEYRKVICPVCKLPTIRGDYCKVQCNNCGWYTYTDMEDY